jgi:hypothetical protein
MKLEQAVEVRGRATRIGIEAGAWCLRRESWRARVGTVTVACAVAAGSLRGGCVRSEVSRGGACEGAGRPGQCGAKTGRAGFSRSMGRP